MEHALLVAEPTPTPLERANEAREVNSKIEETEDCPKPM
jgi:hypothetical protein